MKKSYLWTALKSRLHLVNNQGGSACHWVFLPGGPGLGSESLSKLTELLQLPGSLWHLDLPGDGSNITTNNAEHFSHWSEALVEAVQTFDKVILVAHSTGGMYALATPALEKLLTGLVLMDSAPDASWQPIFMEYVKQHPLAEVEKWQQIYSASPNNELLKKLTLASAPYLFTKAGLKNGIAMLKTLPVNYETCEWSAQYFDGTYKAKWIPKNIPTLILGGDEDHITPLRLFTQSKDFQRNNILIREIKNAGHYPWIDNPDDIHLVFKEYCQKL